MVKRAIIFLVPLALLAQVACERRMERIYCTYYIDRSDNTKGVDVEFWWHSPSGRDDRIKVFHVPPLHGSVYDYRFVPGRESGKWRVVVRVHETNSSSKTTFELEGDEEFFEE
jgi:hypothetical protein